MKLNADYWDNRYKNFDDRWDLGEVSPPLKAYFNQLTNKNLKILIPGGGNSHEAEYLHQSGFANVYVIDVSKTALKNLKKRVPDFPENHLINEDFFKYGEKFDLIIEQTFFCAIHPKLRKNYVEKIESLLLPEGKLVGLLFNCELNSDKPPFAGYKKEYTELFHKKFNIVLMDDCYNSHHSREGRELFIKLTLKK